jgi:hypothetical protein
MKSPGTGHDSCAFLTAQAAPAQRHRFRLRTLWRQGLGVVISGGAFCLLFAFGLDLVPGSGIAFAQSGLVAAYGFDEGAGLSAADASGNAHHGAIAGATWTSTAKFGKALTFDGIDDLVTINDSTALDLTGTWTLEAWVRPTYTSGWRTVLMKESPGELAYALYANDSGAKPSVWLRPGSPGSAQSLAGTAKLTVSTWSHLAATYDRTTLRLFVNGTMVGSRSLTIAAEATSQPLRIGGNLVWGEYFKGQIDEVRLYNRALSATEIRADRDTPLGAAPDTTPPAVAVTSPLGGATVTSTVSVTASASDNVAVTGVQFFVDSAALGAEDTTSPYAVDWNTATAANGLHDVSARARDAAGNTMLSPAMTVSVSNPPKLFITQPANGSTISGATVNVFYTTTGDMTGVNHVHFVLDSAAQVMDMSFDGSYQYASVAPGSHTLNGFLVRADHTKIAATDAPPVTFTTTMPDGTAPIVTMMAPAPGATLIGSVSVAADALDDVGVAGVQFLLDGAALGAEDLTPPFEIVWNTTLAANATHDLSARARDAAGNTAVSGIATVTVANTSGSATIGEWAAPFSMPVVAIHQVLLPTGKVLMWDAADFTSAGPVIWDPQSGAIVNALQNFTDLFCAGHVMLADGRLLTLGGDTRGSTDLGVRDVNQFNAFTSAWSSLPAMTYKRWYPTAVTLSDGRVFVLSGYGECYSANCIIPTPEVFDPVSSTWSLWPTANYAVPSYPFLFGLPDGRLLSAGSYEGTIDTRVLDLSSKTWSVVDPTAIDAGSAVMYEPGKIMKAGKWANSDPPFVPAHANTYMLDMTQPAPAWRQTGPMNFPRAYNVLTLLPDGTTLATGGSLSTDPASTSQGVLEAEIWSPVTETWTSMARMKNPRLYHGTATLLPDGRVLVAGSGRYGSLEQLNGEIFSPPYLFKGPRPVIASAPSVVQPAGTFFVGTADSDIQSVTMLRTGSMTHSFNSDARYLKLPFTRVAGGLTVDAPANMNLAPPGYYLLFLLNSAGVPSTGTFVRVPAPSEDREAPSAPAGLAATGGLANVSLSWAASIDNRAVAGYYVHRSTTPGFVPNLGNRIVATQATSITDSGLAAATYYYRVTAYDLAGNVSVPSSEVSAAATSDTQPPTVSLQSPADGAIVAGSITMTALAADNVGVAGVRFLLDGVSIGAEDTTAPYSIAWNTAGTANGTHQLAATVRDGSGNTATASPITVTVNNLAPTSLVVALGFNEGAGTATVDASGKGNSGTLSSASWTAGKYGSGVSFNGTSSWVTVADAASLDLTGSFTMSAWVKPSSIAGNWRTILLKESSGGLAYSLYAADGAARPPAGYVSVGGGDVLVVAPSAVPLNTWTHLAVTVSGTQMQIYVNGVSVAARNFSGTVSVSSNPLRIGGNAVWGEYFAGVIDEVRIYNRVQTQAEVLADMNTPIS